MNTSNIIYRYIRGSKLYGLETETSDTDYASVYLESLYNLLSLRKNYIEQINNNGNDDVSYSLDRYLTLLLSSNPNMIESLFIPDDLIIFKANRLLSELFENKEMFLTRQLVKILVQYSHSQIKKARGLNKAIVHPVEERKTPLDFCYTFLDQGSISFTDYMDRKGMSMERCGLVNINNMKDVYAVFYDWDDMFHYKGIIGENSNELRLSSIEKGQKPLCHLYYNKDGYISHCKDYKNYQEWKKNRNPERYKINIESDRNYDVKNISHCVRLLTMGEELVEGKGFNVNRRYIDRDFILSIKLGEWKYEDIITIAEKKKKYVEEHIDTCSLPDCIDETTVNKILYNIRKKQIESEYGY